MDHVEELRQQQADFWNGPMGQTWVETQEITDEMLAPACDFLVDEAQRLNARSVLDVGCGNGTTTMSIADALPAALPVTGVDISLPMMRQAEAMAEAKGSKATFLAGDAATCSYPDAPYDVIVSRFGSMFFSDQVGALRHLRGAASESGRLCFVVWQQPEANTFLTVGAEAAAGLLPPSPPRRPNAPGPFAMADKDLMADRLKQAGWSALSFEPVTFTFGFPAKHLEVFMRNLAPIGPGIDQLEEPQREAVFNRVREAFSAYVKNDRLEYEAACLIIRAVAAT